MITEHEAVGAGDLADVVQPGVTGWKRRKAERLRSGEAGQMTMKEFKERLRRYVRARGLVRGLNGKAKG